MPDTLTLDPSTTALVVIDLQQGILARDTTPHDKQDVVERAAKLAAACRKGGATVMLVNVGFSEDEKDKLTPPSDLRITKRQWGAFYGTMLDQQLRRRGIRTIILCGVATNVGVESTARDAWEHGYHLVFAEDAMASLAPGTHEHTMKYTFPRIGRVRSTAEILSAL